MCCHSNWNSFTFVCHFKIHIPIVSEVKEEEKILTIILKIDSFTICCVYRCPFNVGPPVYIFVSIFSTFTPNILIGLQSPLFVMGPIQPRWRCQGGGNLTSPP